MQSAECRVPFESLRALSMVEGQNGRRTEGVAGNACRLPGRRSLREKGSFEGTGTPKGSNGKQGPQGGPTANRDPKGVQRRTRTLRLATLRSLRQTQGRPLAPFDFAALAQDKQDKQDKCRRKAAPRSRPCRDSGRPEVLEGRKTEISMGFPEVPGKLAELKNDCDGT